MTEPLISDLSVFASGVWAVELSVGKRVDARHRVPVTASVDVTTGEVRFSVDGAGIQVLSDDTRPQAAPKDPPQA